MKPKDRVSIPKTKNTISHPNISDDPCEESHIQSFVFVQTLESTSPRNKTRNGQPANSNKEKHNVMLAISSSNSWKSEVDHANASVAVP